jgi:hypothetical protein
VKDEIEKQNAELIREMRVEPVRFAEYSVEIDLTDDRIVCGDKLNFLSARDSKLFQSVSLCYSEFVAKVANGLHIEIGNGLRIDSLQDVAQQTKGFFEKRFMGDTVAFGSSGVDAQLFEFDLRKETTNTESRILWHDFGAITDNAFVLINSRFDAFLTIQYYLLKATDYEPNLSREEAARRALDPSYAQADEFRWQNLIDQLYRLFDPAILPPKYDYYGSALPLSSIPKA